ncbi:MAG: hypothetical protein IPG70_05765 [Moraxellaceae bacterium]|nr:hypothetical protein [Moraxellaceae bacterium]
MTILHVPRQWTFMPYVGRLNIYFSALKVGFHFEEMHLTHYFRIKMIALLAIALAWAHKVGE